jgi:light-regulated signal transduction histidine kinase (bacteriophytochrome)
MQKLINDCLLFPQVDDKDSFEEVDLSQLLNEVLSDMEVEIEKQSAIIKLGALQKYGLLKPDATIVSNLVSNGIKFRKPGSVPVISIYKS